MVANEPGGNLDTKTADQIFEVMREFNRALGVAFLIVTHDPRLAARCDRTIDLVDVRIVSDQWTVAPGPARRPSVAPWRCGTFHSFVTLFSPEPAQ